MPIVDTHKKAFRIYKRNFSRRCIAGFVGGANNCTTVHSCSCCTQLRKRQQQEVRSYSVSWPPFSNKHLLTKLNNCRSWLFIKENGPTSFVGITKKQTTFSFTENSEMLPLFSVNLHAFIASTDRLILCLFNWASHYKIMFKTGIQLLQLFLLAQVQLAVPNSYKSPPILGILNGFFFYSSRVLRKPEKENYHSESVCLNTVAHKPKNVQLVSSQNGP